MAFGFEARERDPPYGKEEVKNISLENVKNGDDVRIQDSHIENVKEMLDKARIFR